MVIGLQQDHIVLIRQISNDTISHSFLKRKNSPDGQTARNTCAAQSWLTTRERIPDVWNAAQTQTQEPVRLSPIRSDHRRCRSTCTDIGQISAESHEALRHCGGWRLLVLLSTLYLCCCAVTAKRQVTGDCKGFWLLDKVQKSRVTYDLSVAIISLTIVKCTL